MLLPTSQSSSWKTPNFTVTFPRNRFLLSVLLLLAANSVTSAFIPISPSFQSQHQSHSTRVSSSYSSSKPAPLAAAASQVEAVADKKATKKASSTKVKRAKSRSSIASKKKRAAVAVTTTSSASNSTTTTTTTMTKQEQPPYPKFADLPRLHPVLRQNLALNMKFDRTTEIQAKTWEPASRGRDVLGRARTGTGKTLSFLLPALQQLLEGPQLKNIKNTIHMLVLSPTRELAAQIDDQAQLLTGGNNKKNAINISHQVVFGGNSKPRDVTRLERCVPTILVATPGRLRDHLQTTTVRGTPFAQLLARTSILVLDETDRLLDMGFRREVEDIISYLPSKQHRQTLLFSATVPPEVKAIMAATMKPDFVTVDCIHDADPASHTNAQVEQKHVIVSSRDRLVTGTLDILYRLIHNAKTAGEPLKLVAFFNTANLVAYYAELFNEGLGIPVLELHSRKSQAFRTRTADQFRAADAAILFTSDVSARGVDYPGVTNVVQFGIADSRESYIHRLGRTGRAGKVGEGLLVLTELEQNFLHTLKGLDVPAHAELQALVDGPPSPVVSSKLDPMFASMANGGHKSLATSARSAYRSMLGFYNGKIAKLMKVKGTGPLVDFVNDFAMQAGLTEIPELEQKTVKKMGLFGVEGLNIVKNGTAGGGGRGGGGGPPQQRNGGGRGDQGRGGGGRGQQQQQQRNGGGRGNEGGGRRDDSNSPMKRHNSVASEMEDAGHNKKKPKQQAVGGGGGTNGGSGGGGRGPKTNNRRRRNNNTNKKAA